MEPTVQPEPTPSEPDAWADIAVELEKIAADCRDLIGQPAPGLFAIDLHPSRITYPPAPKERAATVDAVDTVALVLLGKKAETKRMEGGAFHHTTRGRRGPIELSIYNAVADPALVDPAEEIARLRAEVAELKAKQTDATGLAYTRADDEPDDPTPVSPARVPMHTVNAVSGINDNGHREGEPEITGEVEVKSTCTPACDALQSDPAKVTGLARTWHADDCPVAALRHGS
jgi:hypothetical protein